MGRQTFNRSLSKYVPQLPQTFTEVIVNGGITKKHNCRSQNQNSGRTESHIPKQGHLIE